MKLRITQKDLEALTLEQKQNLCDLWIPHVYDTAVATVCVDAAEERFEQIVYVIGGIKLLKHHDMLLYDLKLMPDETFKLKEEEAYSDNIASDRIDGSETAEAVEDEEFNFDEDFNFEFQRPDSYSKQDCLPLLDIGQMIDILERKNFGQGDFYLSASIGDYVLEMGKNGFSGTIDSDVNNKECELCDILWESIKVIL
ncbi:MAG: hypothetical protein K0R50_2689 [Eubacterium sp.]|jgi:hypothetical protein|nr:hypothetical protein [Eubacterium sp.]